MSFAYYPPPGSGGGSGGTGDMLASNNLSELTNKATARTNLQLTNMSIWNVVPVASGGTGLTSLPTANYLLGANSGGTAYEGKQLYAGPGLNISHSTGRVTFSNLSTIASGNGKPYDLNINNKYYTVITSSNYSLSVVSGTVGQQFSIKLIQDGTGNRTVSWWSGIKWPSDVTPVLSSGISKADWITFIQTSTSGYDGFISGYNYSM